MITIAADKYEEFMQTNDKQLFGSFFDGVNYTFYESIAEAQANDKSVEILPEPPVSNDIDLSNLSQEQLLILANKLKSLL